MSVRIALGSLAMLLVVAGCQAASSGEAADTTMATPPTTTTSMTTTTTIEPTTTAANPTIASTTTSTEALPPVGAEPFPPEEFVGTFRTGLDFITFYESGALEVRETLDDAPFERGTWEIDGAELRLTSNPGQNVCHPSIVGRYWIRWSDDRARILATTIEDRCFDRELRVRNGLPVVDAD